MPLDRPEILGNDPDVMFEILGDLCQLLLFNLLDYYESVLCKGESANGFIVGKELLFRKDSVNFVGRFGMRNHFRKGFEF